MVQFPRYSHLGWKLAVLTAWIAFAGAEVQAKSVAVKWKEIKGAHGYEIQVQKEGAIISQKKTDETEWTGSLDVGVYSYQIRAIDRVKRPGVWSQPKALVVAPKP